MKHWIFWLLMLCGMSAFSQKHIPEEDYYYRLLSDTDLFILPRPEDDKTNLVLTFRAGPYAEDSTIAGYSKLYEELFTEKLLPFGNQYTLGDYFNSIGAKYSSITTMDYVSFQLSFPTAKLEQVVMNLRDALFSNEYHPTALSRKYKPAIKDSTTSMLDYLDTDITTSLLWLDYLPRTIIDFPIADPDSIVHEKLQHVSQRFFCPGNALVVIRGPIEQREVKKKVAFIFDKLDKCQYNHHNRYTIQQYRPLLRSVQMIEGDSLSKTAFHRVQQGPALREFFVEATAMNLMQVIFNKSDHIKELCDSTDVNWYQLGIKAGARQSTIKISYTPGQDSLASAFEGFNQILNQLVDSTDFLEEELAYYKLDYLTKIEAIQQRPWLHLQSMAHFWGMTTMRHFYTYKDTVNDITTDDLIAAFKKNVLDNKYISQMTINPQMKDSLDTDSFFTTTESRVAGYQLFFQKNTDKFNAANNDSIFTSLVQFLKINPEITVQINGTAGKDEILKVKDDAVMKFLKENEDLFIFPKELGPLKRTVRLDLVRAVKVSQMLMDAGIPRYRIFGTGLLLDEAKNDEPKPYKAYCTLNNKQSINKE